eukprot:4551902-Lingulodinium_polyedra.AAC.1
MKPIPFNLVVGQDWNGPNQSNLLHIVLDQTKPIQCNPIQPPGFNGLDWNGQNWTGLDRTGLDWPNPNDSPPP